MLLDNEKKPKSQPIWTRLEKIIIGIESAAFGGIVADRIRWEINNHNKDVTDSAHTWIHGEIGHALIFLYGSSLGYIGIRPIAEKLTDNRYLQKAIQVGTGFASAISLQLAIEGIQFLERNNLEKILLRLDQIVDHPIAQDFVLTLQYGIPLSLAFLGIFEGGKYLKRRKQLNHLQELGTSALQYAKENKRDMFIAIATRYEYRMRELFGEEYKEGSMGDYANQFIVLAKKALDPKYDTELQLDYLNQTKILYAATFGHVLSVQLHTNKPEHIPKIKNSNL